MSILDAYHFAILTVQAFLTFCLFLAVAKHQPLHADLWQRAGRYAVMSALGVIWFGSALDAWLVWHGLKHANAAVVLRTTGGMLLFLGVILWRWKLVYRHFVRGSGAEAAVRAMAPHRI